MYPPPHQLPPLTVSAPAIRKQKSYTEGSLSAPHARRTPRSPARWLHTRRKSTRTARRSLCSKARCPRLACAVWSAPRPQLPCRTRPKTEQNTSTRARLTTPRSGRSSTTVATPGTRRPDHASYAWLGSTGYFGCHVRGCGQYWSAFGGVALALPEEAHASDNPSGRAQDPRPRRDWHRRFPQRPAIGGIDRPRPPAGPKTTRTKPVA